MKKLFSLVLCGMLAFGMVGCEEEEAVNNFDESIKEEQQKEVEEPVQEEEVEDEFIPEVEKDISDDVDGAYELLKPFVDESFDSVDCEYKIIDGKIYLVGYLPPEEILAGIYSGQWDTFVEKAEQVSDNMKILLDESGYTDVDFVFAICDETLRDDKCFLAVTNGIVMYNVAEE